MRVISFMVMPTIVTFRKWHFIRENRDKMEHHLIWRRHSSSASPLKRSNTKADQKLFDFWQTTEEIFVRLRESLLQLFPSRRSSVVQLCPVNLLVTICWSALLTCLRPFISPSASSSYRTSERQTLRTFVSPGGTLNCLLIVSVPPSVRSSVCTK